MGVDVKGALSLEIEPEDIYTIIINNFDKNAIYGIKEENYEKIYGQKTYSGFITFKYNEEQRNLIYCQTKDYSKIFNNKMHGNLILGKWGNSVEIITEILKHFGGYLDENDCDEVEIEDTYIAKDKDFNFNEYSRAIMLLYNQLDLPNKSNEFKMTMAKQIYNNKNTIMNIMTEDKKCLMVDSEESELLSDAVAYLKEADLKYFAEGYSVNEDEIRNKLEKLSRMI